MAQDYTVTEILATYDAQFGKKRIAFKTNETGERSLSVFTQYPDSIREGAVLYGDVEEKTVDNRTFYNFKFVKKGAEVATASGTPGLAEIKNMLNLKVIPLLIELTEGMRNLVGAKRDYPEYNSSNDAHPFDDE